LEQNWTAGFRRWFIGGGHRWRRRRGQALPRSRRGIDKEAVDIVAVVRRFRIDHRFARLFALRLIVWIGGDGSCRPREPIRMIRLEFLHERIGDRRL
jgi:hypothetical protein